MRALEKREVMDREIRSLAMETIRKLKESGEVWYCSEDFRTYGYYDSDVRRAGYESNFEAAFEELGGKLALKKGWIDNSGGELSVHISQPFILVKLLKLERYIKEDYPLLDDADANEREREYADETFEFYKKEFVSSVKEVAKEFGLKVSKYKQKDYAFFARMIFEESHGYSGLDNAWVDRETILRPIEDYFCCSLESFLETNSKLYKDLVKKISKKGNKS